LLCRCPFLLIRCRARRATLQANETQTPAGQRYRENRGSTLHNRNSRKPTERCLLGIALYPVLRRYRRGPALGAVGFRIIEGTFYAFGAVSVLLLLTLRGSNPPSPLRGARNGYEDPLAEAGFSRFYREFGDISMADSTALTVL